MQRLITSLILIPLILLLIFYADPRILVAIGLLITVLAGRECFQLIPIHYPLMQISYILMLLVGIWLCHYMFPYWMTLGIVIWLCIDMAIISFPLSQKYWGKPFIVATALFIVWPLFIQSLIHTYELQQGKALIIYLFFLIWSADIGAYLAGKQWGRHLLIPQVSPGKSWEGVLGGLLLSLIVAAVASIYFKPHSLIKWFLWATLTVIISIFGDLFVSILKRRCHLKDTGSIISGHGGLLDRLDSLIAASPIFYLGLI